MNVSELQKCLREKERELWVDMKRTEADGRASGTAETQNGRDSAESKEGLFQESTADWNVYTQVREALQRIEEGTYGKCADCGREIEEHRLNSVPWSTYCLKHQDQHEQDLAARPS